MKNRHRDKLRRANTTRAASSRHCYSHSAALASHTATIMGGGATSHGGSDGKAALAQYHAELKKAKERNPSQAGTLSFPPLVAKWTNGGSTPWPGAEYTRRTRMKTRLQEGYSEGFVNEINRSIGERRFANFTESMKPSVSSRLRRGLPPAEEDQGAHRHPIKPAYTLPRADKAEAAGFGDTMRSSITQILPPDISSATIACTGIPSKTRFLDCHNTDAGPVPVYMFEDREQMGSFDEWFEKYGRPKVLAVRGERDRALEPRSLYTRYQPLNKRCCGNPSLQQKMKRGIITQ